LLLKGSNAEGLVDIKNALEESEQPTRAARPGAADAGVRPVRPLDRGAQSKVGCPRSQQKIKQLAMQLLYGSDGRACPATEETVAGTGKPQ
jgi:hypothetical protein